MTISTTTSKVIWQGNGATTAFSYSFAMPIASEAVLTYTDTFGNQTVLNAAQYSITGVGTSTTGGGTQGGTVTYPLTGSPIAAGTTLTLQRVIPYTQPTSLANQSGFWPSVVEGMDDNLEMQIQQLAEIAARSLQFNPADAGPFNPLVPAAERANMALMFDANGNPIAGLPASTTAAISAAMLAVVQAASRAAALTLLGLPNGYTTPELFGAVGNGTTDDSAAINAAISSLSGTGGTVVFAPKNYAIASTINLARGVNLQGFGSSIYYTPGSVLQVTTITWVGGTTGQMLAGGNNWQGRMENIVFDGAYLAYKILGLGAPQNSIFRNLLVMRTNSTVQGWGISMDGSSGQTRTIAGNNTFDTVIVALMHYGALYLNGVTGTTFINCNFQSFAGLASGSVCVTFNSQCDTNQFIGGIIALDVGATSGTCMVLNYSTTNTDVFGNNFYGTAFLIDSSLTTAYCIDARNNQDFNHFYGCYLPGTGTVLSTGNGSAVGKVKFWGCQFAATGNSFGAISVISTTSSPYTYTNSNNNGVQQEVQLWDSGGSISALSFTRNGANGAIGTNVSTLILEPGDSITVTFTGTLLGHVVPH